ncbi:MAG: hypothetical protein ACM3S4_12425 [Burkholderiales bacterium]
MGLFDKRMEIDSDYAYKAFIKSGGAPAASGKAKYIGGHTAIKGERKGELAVNNAGVFFNGKKTGCYFFLPAEKILRAAFETGEAVSKNAAFSRLLAIGGFAFAYKQKTREKHMFLTIDYVENGLENAVLFETAQAGDFAGAIAKARHAAQEEARKKAAMEPDRKKTVSELMIEINELHALGILTSEEFTAKKRELLSRI